MSVINQMLRDLDQRQEKKAAAKASPSSQVNPRVTRFPRWAVLVLVAMLGLWLLWFLLGARVFTLPGEPSVSAVLDQTQPLASELSTTEQGISEQNAPEPSDPESGIAEQSQAVPTAQILAEQVDVTVPQLQTNLAIDDSVTEPDGIGPVSAVLAETVDSQQSNASQVETEQVQPTVSSMRVDRVELTHQQQISQLQQQALEAEQRGQTEQARQKWQQLIALEPAMAEPYLALAQAAQLRGNEAGVQYWLQLALQQTSESTEVHQQLAASYARQQLWTETLQQLAQINDMALSFESRALQATAMQQLGHHTQALQSFEWLAEQQPQQARWWLGMALSHDALGHSGQAVELFTRSLQLGGNLNPATVTYIQQRIQDLN